MDTYRFQLKEGRFFAPENATDEKAIVLNEVAVRSMGLENPVGKRLLDISDEITPLSIIGTVKDFHLQFLRDAIRPMGLLLLQGNSGRLLSIRINPGKTQPTLDFIKQQWDAFNPGQPIDYVFLDERFNRGLKADLQTGNVFSAFAGLAIFIACLGLFGLASFMAELKTKEIGVRKVLGATVPGIVILLSKEYVKWLALANLLAWPLAYYAMYNWLQNFAFRIDISIWPFLLAGGAALIIALMTVSYQSIKAAVTHPVKCLRYE
jgi:putative ABC transport system permease protein